MTLNEHLLSGLRILAGQCDGAHQRDEHGFSAFDVVEGHRLAALDVLPQNDVYHATHLCMKYRRQLGEEFMQKLTELQLMDESESSTTITTIEAPLPQASSTLPPEPILAESLDNVTALTDEQEQAIDIIQSWLAQRDRLEYKLGGYAGTGKTTVIKELIAQLRRAGCFAVVSAFTGKAVNVLQRKGVSAQTLHSLLYDVYEDEKGDIMFTRKPSLKDDPSLIIVDEASMISTDLYDDLNSFDIPKLYVGDPGQLEPVGDNPNLMARPQFVLSKIHRQAERSPIIRFATDIRMGARPELCESDELTVKRKVVRASEYLACDQAICAKNVTRRNLNMKIREVKGYREPLVLGEKLICLRNNRMQGVFNGMLLFVEKITAEGGTFWECTLTDEVGRRLHRKRVWKEPLVLPQVQEGTVRVPFNHVYCDYGYVITCHKSQGSEWDNVIVLDEWMPPTVWDMKRWRYTAITRAAKRLTFCI